MSYLCDRKIGKNETTALQNEVIQFLLKFNLTIHENTRLRDGGYYTNWDFDNELVNEYFKAAEKLPIDYIEIGYRNLQINL